jgi:lysophospholipase L1-like esterase
MMLTKLKPLLFSLLSRCMALLLGCLIAFSLSEAVLRYTGFEWTLYPSKVQFGWPTPTTFQWRYKPDAEFLWVRKDMESMLDVLRTDSRPGIAFIGDSCTEIGQYVDKFRQKMETVAPGQYAIAALGTGGWSSYQGRQFFDRRVAALKPEIAVFYFGWNDHWSSFGVEDKDMARYYELFPVIPAVSQLRTVQMINFFLFRFHFKTEHYPNRVAPEDFYKNLVAMIQIAKANGIQPVILTAPSSHERGKEPKHLWERHMQNLSELVPMHEQYVELARKAAKDQNVLLIDLYQYFRQFPPEKLTNNFFESDGIHLQEAGDTLIAEQLIQGFQRGGLLQGK